MGRLSEDFVLEQLKQGHVTFFKGDAPLSEFSRPLRAMLRARIAAMDMAHKVNKGMADKGWRLPPAVRRLFRILVEGR